MFVQTNVLAFSVELLLAFYCSDLGVSSSTEIQNLFTTAVE